MTIRRAAMIAALASVLTVSVANAEHHRNVGDAIGTFYRTYDGRSRILGSETYSALAAGCVAAGSPRVEGLPGTQSGAAAVAPAGQ